MNKYCVAILVMSFLFTGTSFASPIDHFKNASGTLNNFSQFPTSSLKIVYSIYRCKPVLAHLDCEGSPLRLRKYPVSQSGRFTIDELGMPNLVATKENEILWRFQIEFPDGVISNNVDSDEYRDSERRLGFADDLILTRINQLNVFRMPDMKITFMDASRKLISPEKLLKSDASYYTQASFNPTCMTEYEPRSFCSKKITSNPFVIKGLAVHKLTPVSNFKNYLSISEGVTIDDPDRPLNWVLHPYREVLNFADYSFSDSIWKRKIVLPIPNAN